MNKRIKELAVQAGFQYIKDEGIGWAGNYNASLPKFAELIVRECMVVINQSNGVGDDDVIKISQDVKKHFGVE